MYPLYFCIRYTVKIRLVLPANYSASAGQCLSIFCYHHKAFTAGRRKEAPASKRPISEKPDDGEVCFLYNIMLYRVNPHSKMPQFRDGKMFIKSI